MDTSKLSKESCRSSGIAPRAAATELKNSRYVAIWNAAGEGRMPGVYRVFADRNRQEAFRVYVENTWEEEIKALPEDESAPKGSIIQ